MNEYRNSEDSPYTLPPPILSATGHALARRDFIKDLSKLTAGAVLAPLFNGNAFAAVGGNLRIMAWEGFTLEQELRHWREQNKVQVNAAILSTQDDVHARFVGGKPLPLDISEYNQGYAKFYGNDLKIMLPLDAEKIPNYSADKIFSGFYLGDYWYWNGRLLGIPWVWGLNSLVYNPAHIPIIQSYRDLLNPNLKGKLTIGDDNIATWPMIARVAGLGYKFPNLSVQELDTAFKAMEPYRDQCRVFSASNGDSINLLVSGEVSAVFCGWSGIITETARQGVETRYALPEEGASMWCDAWFIPISATNIDTAHAFINESLAPQVQAAACKAVVGGAVSKESLQYMDAETLAYFDYNNLAQIQKKSPLQGIPPFHSEHYATYAMWVDKWTSFKAGF